MSGGYLADPNREAVGLEPAWAEGHGGSDTSGGSGGPAADPLDDMTKSQLLEEAQERGVEADESMTKAEIKDAIQAG